MKVLHLHDKPLGQMPAKDPSGPPTPLPGGGIAAYLEQLFPALQSRGWQTSVIRFSAHPAEPPSPSCGCHELPSSGFRPRPALHRRLECMVNEDNPDIVHLHSVYFAMNPWMVRRVARIKPVVCTFHDVTALCFKHNKRLTKGGLCHAAVGLRCLSSGCYRLGSRIPILRDLVHVALNGSHLNAYRKLPAVIVPSEYLAGQLVVNRFDRQRIAVIPAFSRFTQEPTLDAPEGRILYVGRLVEDKGILVLLQALALLREEPWRLTVVGDGPLLETIQQQVQGHGLHTRVEYLGQLGAGDLRQAYRSCSLVVMPSLIPEAFGLVGVEANAFARPVVTFAEGGQRQWLDDGFNGLVARYADVQDLADKIRLLLSDRDLRLRLGQQGQQRVAQRFTLDHHVMELLALYQQLIVQFRGTRS